ncbi:hypothetical protein ACJJIF_03000 [Microbulbifer sp. SSSA002]|uniref:hypothetical protein n=1 Tax=unclassified Microbulbifer TaxID=2619833 RepID=UPI00403A4A0A
MNCNSCDNEFEVAEVVKEKKGYGIFSAIFPCPECGVLLRIDKKFKSFRVCGIIGFLLGLILLIFNQVGLLPIDYRYSIVLMVLGSVLFEVSVAGMGTEIVE